MSPSAYLYRHDSIVVPRPYGIDVDADDWLWEGVTGNRLLAHNLRTAELRVVIVPEMQNKPVYSTHHIDGKLVLQMGEAQFYLVYDTKTGRCERRNYPGDKHVVSWYGAKMPGGKLMLCDRGAGEGSQARAIILDAPDAEPRVVPFPYRGDFSGASLQADGLLYTFLGDPARVVRFDPAKELFIDEQPLPWPEVGVSNRFSHDGVMYAADSSGGRMLRLDLASQTWLEPIPHPDHGKVFGFIGGGFDLDGVGYFCLSTYAHRSRIDSKTGKILMPPAGTALSIDGQAPRFMERMLTFDARTQRFDYLVAPPQPDGVPLLCYSWTDGKRFAVTGLVLPLDGQGHPIPQTGHWLVLQSEPAHIAEAEPFGRFDFTHDRFVQMHKRRRQYSYRRALYLPESPHVPPIIDHAGQATSDDPGRTAELLRRAAATDAKAYWSNIVQAIMPGDADPSAAVRTILGHANKYIYYNPIQVPRSYDPIVVHEAREGRCGHVVNVTLELFKAAGIEARRVSLRNHTVAEVYYDGGWHIADALFFGESQPARDGCVLSVDELKADPYFADSYPQWCFAYDPELLVSEDGYQVLGYVFGLWGSEPYYSYYLGAPKDQPPTLPTTLPAQRIGRQTVRVNWSRSIKANSPDAVIEYDVGIFRDRVCDQPMLSRVTTQTSIDFDGAEPDRMYFVRVHAMDEHRKQNPATWYPPARWNFVAAPPRQYGWYGIL